MKSKISLFSKVTDTIQWYNQSKKMIYLRMSQLLTTKKFLDTEKSYHS